MTELEKQKLSTEIAVIKNELSNQKEQNSVEHKEIKDTLVKINDKLDDAINCKADRTELEKAQTKIDKINEGLLVSSRSAQYQTVGLVFTAIAVLVTLILAIKK